MLIAEFKVTYLMLAIYRLPYELLIGMNILGLHSSSV